MRTGGGRVFSGSRRGSMLTTPRLVAKRSRPARSFQTPGWRVRVTRTSRRWSRSSNETGATRLRWPRSTASSSTRAKRSSPWFTPDPQVPVIVGGHLEQVRPFHALVQAEQAPAALPAAEQAIAAAQPQRAVGVAGDGAHLPGRRL